jgi:restriction endonuclease S subunit
MGNVRDGEVSLPEIGAWNDVPEEMLLRDKDLLFNRTNSQVHVGKVGIFREVPGEKVSFASYLVRLRFTESADPEFMNYFLNNTAFLKSAQSNAYPSINQSNLNPTRYGALKVCLPSIETQRRIVTFLHAEKKRVGELVSRIKSGVQLLLEHRVALISAAVTGQIDVREEVQLDE